jgi:hypothetical protein
MPPRIHITDEPSELELPDADGQLGDEDQALLAPEELDISEQTEEFDDAAAHDLTDGTELLSFVEEHGLLEGPLGLAQNALDHADGAGEFAEEENLLAEADTPGIDEEELDIAEAEVHDDGGDEGPLTDDAALPGGSEAQLDLGEGDGEEGDEMESLLLFGQVSKRRPNDSWNAELVLRAVRVADLCLTSVGPVAAGEQVVALDHAGLVRFSLKEPSHQVEAQDGRVVFLAGGKLYAVGDDHEPLAVEAPESLRQLAVGGRILALADSGTLYVLEDQQLRRLRGDVRMLGKGTKGEGSIFISEEDGRVSLHLAGLVRPVANPPAGAAQLQVCEDRALMEHEGALLELVGSTWERYALADEWIRGACHLDDGDVAFVVAAGDVLAVLRRSEGELSQLGQLPCVEGPVHLRWDTERQTLWIGGAFGALRLQRPKER